MYPERYYCHNWLIHRATNRLLRECFPLLSGTVLDLGAGDAPFRSDICAVADRYIAVDWQNSLHAGAIDVMADLSRPLPFCTASVDHVVLFEVLEHVPRPGTLLAEISRILRSGGNLILSVPYQWWTHEAPWDFFRFTPHGLQFLLRESGLELVSLQPKTGLWGTLALKVNYKSASWARGPKVVRWILRAAFAPAWFFNQWAACILDRMWPDAREAAGFVVQARKPWN